MLNAIFTIVGMYYCGKYVMWLLTDQQLHDHLRYLWSQR